VSPPLADWTTNYAFDRDIKTSALAEDSSNLRLAEGCRNPENRVVSQLARLKWKSIPDGVPLRDM
jgi:hypothetical protein